MPRSDKLIKGAFYPKLDLLFFADYSQIEYRLLAYFLAAQLGDYSMAENFKRGIDPHSATARLMLGLSEDVELIDEQRQVGKTGNFSIMYAGGTPTIMRQLGCNKTRATELLQALRKNMPGVQNLNEAIREVYRSRGHIYTIAGRHLTVDPAIVEARGANRAESALLNYLIQGSAAELMRHALIKIHRWLAEEGYRSHMVNVVHDEVCLDIPRDELHGLVTNIPRLMGDEKVEEYVPIKVDIKISDTSWADAKELSE